MGTTEGGLPYPEPTDDLRGGADAIRALAEAVDPRTNVVVQSLPFANNGVTAYTSGNLITLSNVGSLIAVQGIATANTDAGRTAVGGASAGANNTIGTLPVGMRPPVSVYVQCQGSSSDKWLLTIANTGLMYATRYSPSVPSKPWLIFSATFLASPALANEG